MNEWGLTKHGFMPKTYEAIKSEIEAQLKNKVDPSLHFGPDSIAGVLSSIVSLQTRKVWENLAGLYHSLQPQSAQGRDLDALCSLTGTFRKPASKTKAIASVTLDKDATLKIGTQISLGNDRIFATTESIENNSNKTKKFNVKITALNTGPVIASLDNKAEFVSPEAGWVDVTIKEITKVGSHQERDEELRIRRLDELRASGASTKDSIQKRLEKIEGVRSVYIDEGEHEFEAVVDGGHENAIVHTLWLTKPLGVRTIGEFPVKINDRFAPNKEKKREIRYSRPTKVPLKLNAALTVKKKLDKEETESLKQTIADFAAEYFQLGTQVYASRFYATILAQPNVLDVSLLKIRDLANGEEFSKSVSPRELGVLAAKEIYIDTHVEDEL